MMVARVVPFFLTHRSCPLIGASKLPLRIQQAYNLVEKLRKLTYLFSTLKL